MPHEPVSDRQRARARDLRQTMTRAETLLWRHLKAHRADGLGFRRQTPIGPYIVDFVCHAAQLIVELDGESHDFPSRQNRDEVRDAWLRSQGFRVLRFTNDEVLGNLEGVVMAIQQAAAARMSPSPPLPNPPPQGGREPACAVMR
ncbi:MAG: endonuclease domain-containing protein [Methylacidiphilales bacterium]|nr:endonuclease domain-containing protein [Candidatus Methylacidiphilales bacterium]